MYLVKIKMVRFSWLFAFIYLLLAAGCASTKNSKGVSKSEDYGSNDPSKTAKNCTEKSRYIFSWGIVDGCDMVPRGGSSEGAPVTLDKNIQPAWLALQEDGITTFERDRRAILAMAGPYRTSFEFLEVVGYTPDFTPDKPYQSWGTEYVYVLEDRGDFISLQHIMVMFFQQGEKTIGPMVMKHWRQDWQFQKAQVLQYQGDNQWQLNSIPPEMVEGTWAQAVYQVDDSPRYESYGAWSHENNYSSWQSQLTWRPLPRREHSVRDDYDILEGTNRHTILPFGWVHEQENLKRVLHPRTGSNSAQQTYTFLAKELGVNRYQRIVGHDFSAGDEYVKKTDAFWRDVREAFDKAITSNGGIKLKTKVDNTPLFAPLFEYADALTKGKTVDPKEQREFVERTLFKYQH